MQEEQFSKKDLKEKFAKINKQYKILNKGDLYNKALEQFTQYVVGGNIDNDDNDTLARLYHMAILGFNQKELDGGEYQRLYNKEYPDSNFKLPSEKHINGDGILYNARKPGVLKETEVEKYREYIKGHIEYHTGEEKQALSAFAHYPGMLNKMPVLMGTNRNPDPDEFAIKAIADADKGMYITGDDLSGAFSDCQLLHDINTAGQQHETALVVKLNAHGGYTKSTGEFVNRLYLKNHLISKDIKDKSQYIRYPAMKFQKVLDAFQEKHEGRRLIFDVHSCTGRGMTKHITFPSNVMQIFHASSKYTASAGISESAEVMKPSIEHQDKWSNQDKIVSQILENVAHVKPITLVINDKEQIDKILHMTGSKTGIYQITGEEKKGVNEVYPPIRVKVEGSEKEENEKSQRLVVKLSPNLSDAIGGETEKILNERLSGVTKILTDALALKIPENIQIPPEISSEDIKQGQREIIVQAIAKEIKREKHRYAEVMERLKKINNEINQEEKSLKDKIVSLDNHLNTMQNRVTKDLENLTKIVPDLGQQYNIKEKLTSLKEDIKKQKQEIEEQKKQTILGEQDILSDNKQKENRSTSDVKRDIDKNGKLLSRYKQDLEKLQDISDKIKNLNNQHNNIKSEAGYFEKVDVYNNIVKDEEKKELIERAKFDLSPSMMVEYMNREMEGDEGKEGTYAQEKEEMYALLGLERITRTDKDKKFIKKLKDVNTLIQCAQLSRDCYEAYQLLRDNERLQGPQIAALAGLSMRQELLKPYGHLVERAADKQLDSGRIAVLMHFCNIGLKYPKRYERYEYLVDKAHLLSVKQIQEQDLGNSKLEQSIDDIVKKNGQQDKSLKRSEKQEIIQNNLIKDDDIKVVADFKNSMRDANAKDSKKLEVLNQLFVKSDKEHKAQSVTEKELSSFFSKALSKLGIDSKSDAREKGSVVVLPEHNHTIDHSNSMNSIVKSVKEMNAEEKKNTVVFTERKEDGDNRGMKDVKALATVLGYNEDKLKREQIAVSEPENSNLYKDAEVYSELKTDGMKLRGMEGKDICVDRHHPQYKEIEARNDILKQEAIDSGMSQSAADERFDPDKKGRIQVHLDHADLDNNKLYYQVHDEHIVENTVNLVNSGKNVIMSVGSAHLEFLLERLKENGVEVEIKEIDAEKQKQETEKQIQEVRHQEKGGGMDKRSVITKERERRVAPILQKSKEDSDKLSRGGSGQWEKRGRSRSVDDSQVGMK